MSVQSDRGKDEIDELDEDERSDDSAEPVDKAIAAQDGSAVERTELHSAQRQRDERRNDQRVVNDRRQDRGVRVVQAHHVENLQLGIYRDEHGGQVAKE